MFHDWPRPVPFWKFLSAVSSHACIIEANMKLPLSGLAWLHWLPKLGGLPVRCHAVWLTCPVQVYLKHFAHA